MNSYADGDTMNKEARQAALAGTRQMIGDDSFDALVAVLTSANAIPDSLMASTLEKLADAMIAKARGEMEADYMVYPAELLSRARTLGETAAALRARHALPEISRRQ